MKMYEWIIPLLLIGLGIMSLAVCGTFNRVTQAAYWLSFLKMLLEVTIWIILPLLIVYSIILIYKKTRKNSNKY